MISDTLHKAMTGVIRRQYDRAREDLSVRFHSLGDPDGDLVSVIEGLCTYQLHAGIVKTVGG